MPERRTDTPLSIPCRRIHPLATAISTNLHGTIFAGTRKQTASTATPGAFWHSRRSQWLLTRRHRQPAGLEMQQPGWKQDSGVEKQGQKGREAMCRCQDPRPKGQYGRCDLAPSLAKSTTRHTAQQDRVEAPRRRGRDATGSRLSIDGPCGMKQGSPQSIFHSKTERPTQLDFRRYVQT